MKKWFLVIAVLFASVIIAAFMLNATGVLDLKALAIQQIETAPAMAPHVETYRMGQAVEEEMARLQAELEIERDELAQLRLELDNRAKALSAQEKKFAKSVEEMDSEKESLVALRDEVNAAKMGLL